MAADHDKFVLQAVMMEPEYASANIKMILECFNAARLQRAGGSGSKVRDGTTAAFVMECRGTPRITFRSSSFEL